MVRLGLSLLLTALCYLAYFPAKASDCAISFAVSNDFPPFQFKDGTGQWKGVAVELARSMVNGVGCKIDILDLPWQRAVDMVKRGELDVLPLITANPKREAYMNFVGPMGLEQIVFVAQGHLATQVNTPADLKRFPGLIGKTKGTEYSEKIERLIADEQIAPLIVDNVSDANKIEMLVINRLGGVFEEQSVAEYYFFNGILDPEEYEICLTFLPNPIYFGVSSKSVSIKPSGALTGILAQNKQIRESRRNL